MSHISSGHMEENKPQYHCDHPNDNHSGEKPARATQEPLTVGIMGGGIGGIALALACQRMGKGELHATVFEKDVSFNARSQGYGLTVQQVRWIL
jgi:hypothetical protein